MTSVLVTGVSGDVGQGVVKALRLSKTPYAIHGCDMKDRAGRAFVETFHTVPKATNSRYNAALEAICRQVGASVVIPCSEVEIDILSHPHSLPSDIRVLCQPYEYVHHYGDKLLCYESLAGRIPIALFADGTNTLAVERLVKHTRRVVIKPRKSCGSKNIREASDLPSVQAALKKTSMPVVQEYIEGDEFSVGVFACEQLTTAIAFKRELGPSGTSVYAETSYDSQVLDYALSMAEITDLRGSINVQVRKSSQGVRLLEINPRFSGLVAARAACGFRDAEWSLDLLLGKEPCLTDNYRSARFLRFFHELVDYGDGPHALTEWLPTHVKGNE